MIISELLSQKPSHDIKTISPDATLLAVAAMLSEHNIGALLVEDGLQEMVGIISERDLARALVASPREACDHLVGEVMTRGVITCDVEDNVADILDMMNEQGIRHLPVMENRKRVAILSIRDFNMAYRRLQSLALTDYMTGLANRRHFMELLEQEICRRRRFGTPLSVIMADIDCFKGINDTYGHAAGDDVICALGSLMTAQCRIYDVVARLGGEEYAILCPNTDQAGAIVLGERIMRSVRSHAVETGDDKIRFTVSFGVYEACGKNEDSAAILSRVDSLLYRAKTSGRDCLVAGKFSEEEGDDTGTFAA